MIAGVGAWINWFTVMVPLYMAELREKGGPTEDDWQQAKDFGCDVLPEACDVMMFPETVQQKKKARYLRTRTARMIAVLAFTNPGGVMLFKERFCNECVVNGRCVCSSVTKLC